MEKKYKAKRIRKWLYYYRGFAVECVGYYNPEHRICWEAMDIRGYSFAQDYTARGVCREIDYLIESGYLKAYTEYKEGTFDEYKKIYDKVE